jgi:tRNA-2-methylthio-N6-dimethylallyladenosine synthase
MNVKSKKIFLQTYGCQMNKLDSALVSAALKEGGVEIVGSENEADAVLINTCSVRQHAEERVLSHLGNLKHIKESRPELVVGVIGCMAQRMGGELLKHSAVDIVCGPGQIIEIVELVKNAIEKKSKSLSVAENIRKAPADERKLDDFETQFDNDEGQPPGQAYVRVMRGCNKFCSYCIVPFVRGPEVSREPKVIIEQIKRLADDGVKQITLLGQTVNSYEYKEGGKTSCLADILEIANAISGIEWIRFVTNYPAERYFERICKAMRDLPKVCPYLHIPAQSGSDKILKAMNRKYTAEKYLELLEKAKSIVPGIAVAGDFIVGFPGETDEDFARTVELTKKARYKNCFVFKYSPRPGTAGEKKLKDDVPAEVKGERNIELLAVQEKISDELSKEFLGKEVRVLVEGASKKSHRDGQKLQLVSRTDTDWIVVFEGDKNLAGKFAKVKITKVSPLTLFGEIC